MDKIRPLPDFMVERFQDWTGYQDKKELYKKLVDEGQHPHGMIISCCDSRVQMSSIFDADPGDFFILSLIHISEPTRLLSISYAVFCLKKKKA